MAVHLVIGARLLAGLQRNIVVICEALTMTAMEQRIRTLMAHELRHKPRVRLCRGPPTSTRALRHCFLRADSRAGLWRANHKGVGYKIHQRWNATAYGVHAALRRPQGAWSHPAVDETEDVPVTIATYRRGLRGLPQLYSRKSFSFPNPGMKYMQYRRNFCQALSDNLYRRNLPSG